MEISKEEFRSLKIKAKRFDKIEQMIDSGIISLYIQPGPNFDYGDSIDDISSSCHSVSSLSSFNDEYGENALTKYPFMIEHLIIENGRRQKMLMEKFSKAIEKPKKIDDEVNIYLMKNKRNGYIKIGLTKGKPEYRESTLQSQEPEIELMFSFKSKRSTEEKLHYEFSNKRLRGEWFELSDDDVNDIKNRFMQEWEL